MTFPITRMRRLRRSAPLRSLVRETRLSVDGFVYPVFVRPGSNVREPIASMPGQYRWSVDRLAGLARDVVSRGVPAVLLFGLPEHKDDVGSGAYAPDGIVQTAARTIKDAVPELVIIADTCLDEYTSHGHCGILTNGEVDNDATLDVLARIAASQAQAGVDIVAPSDMMDGRVAAIRRALDAYSYSSVPIMAYSAKFASAFYGPFREAADCAPQFGDRRGYQMDPGNRREAVREAALDVEEGADIIMVKPALAYLDIVREAREAFALPLAAYNVSGEYAMVKAAVERGWLDEQRTTLEILTSIQRAGADIIITYHACEAAGWLESGAV
ncbi:MAG: porphobilinogen synthase [Chloroflexota bacterium]